MGWGWDGMVRQGERVVRYGAGCGYGKVRQVRGVCGGWWWVVWAEFELGCCSGRKEVGGQAGRRAGAGESWHWELGELGGKSRGRRETERWRAAHTHALTLSHDSDKLSSPVDSSVLSPRVATALRVGT